MKYMNTKFYKLKNRRFLHCWPLTLTAKTLSLKLSFTFIMGPYEPLAMKPRTWEHKSEAIPVFPLLQLPSSHLTDFCFVSTLPENGLVLDTDTGGTQAWRQRLKLRLCLTPQLSQGQGVYGQLLQTHNMQTTDWVSDPKRPPCQSGAHDWADDAHLPPAASLWTTIIL